MEAQTYKDVPATPTGESLLIPPTSYVVMHTAIGLENPIDDIESLKSFFSNSIMLKIPRFSSLLVKHPNGTHSFRRTKVDIDKHFIIVPSYKKPESESDYEDLVNDYMAELSTVPPMSEDKPLWEIHVLVEARCLVLSVHHAICDGASFCSMLRDLGRSPSGGIIRQDDVKSKPAKQNFRLGKGEGILGMLRFVWFSTVFGFDLGVKAFLRKDKETVLNSKGGIATGYGPRKAATAKFNLDDVKLVKKVIPNATINDVLCGIIWGGLNKYIAARTSSGDGKAPKEGHQITGLVMVNVRRIPGLQELSTMDGERLEKFWGNKTGLFLLPLHYTKEEEDAFSFVRKAKSILDKKKKSAEPRFNLRILQIAFRLFGPKASTKVLMRAVGRTTFGLTNMMGPSEQIFIDGNPVAYLRVSPSNNGLAIVVLLLSYKKNLDIQIVVDEDVIPDPKFVAACFKHTFQGMIDALN